MKLNHNIAWVACVLIALASNAACAADSISPECTALLKKVCVTYAKARSLSCKITAKVNLDSEKGPQEQERDYFFVSEKPNKYYCQFQSKSGGMAVSDGKNVEYYMPKMARYTTDGAPANIEDGMNAEEFALVTGAALTKSFLPQLLGTTPYDELMQDVSRASLAANQAIEGVDCKHIVLTKADHQVDVWMTTTKNPKIQMVRFGLAKAPSQSKSALSYLFQNQVIDIPVNPGKFAPPHAATAAKVDSFINDPHKRLIGKRAPDVLLKMENGTALRLNNLKDRVVVLDFWATWCGPCVMSMPVFAMESQKFKDRGVTFIPVNEGEGKAQVQAFMKEHRLPVLCALDNDNALGNVFHTEAIPETVFIGKDGTVKGIHIGISQDFKDRFVTDLESVLAGKNLAEH